MAKEKNKNIQTEINNIQYLHKKIKKENDENDENDENIKQSNIKRIIDLIKKVKYDISKQ
jgi:hypothetical protein